ncbi:hypothetical protein FOCC_FOCC012830 [Frankliniella occidentalis]|uniref:Uncharacterized protein C1orf131 homolog n=1 Tax=Frankliniella occidentalis TaxID=133901 RepID=A0A6J1SHK9_FRAOC|nr:uncharacterized protein C1orf131 homolog [Frankliniella occidentalis]KAE8741628.1 hypothetical protein FOCC_FOCC012830 [Frankliniella occidentalis]
MSSGFIVTKSSLSRQSKPAEFEEVVFNSHKRKEKNESASAPVKKKNKLPDPIPKRENDEQHKFLKKARYEVMRFGMTGFDAAKREETKQAIAISLGAKPKKNKGINYKELMEIRKKQKEEEKANKAFHNIGKTTTGHASANTKKGKKGNRQHRSKGDQNKGILGVYGKVNKHELPKKK